MLFIKPLLIVYTLKFPKSTKKKLNKVKIKDKIEESDYCPDKLGNKGDDRVSFSSTTVYSNPITSEVGRRFYSFLELLPVIR